MMMKRVDYWFSCQGCYRLCESACSINEEVVAWEESEDGDYYYNENEIEI